MRRFLLLALIATLASLSINAQEVEDTIKIKTRVVFLDALVKDKKTNLPISNLTQENFEVLDDGKPRPISYFTREGQARKPLALILIWAVFAMSLDLLVGFAGLDPRDLHSAVFSRPAARSARRSECCRFSGRRSRRRRRAHARSVPRQGSD